jgi:hypothetical protein
MIAMGPALKVKRDEFQQALRFVSKVAKGTTRAEAIISFDGGSLELDLGGVTARASAQGEWPGPARVNAQFLLGLLKTLPDGDPLTVSAEDDRVHVCGSRTRYSAKCTWQDAEGDLIKLELNPSLVRILCLRIAHADEDITRSGLTRILEEAEARRDTLIARAADALVPLGIRPGDVRRLVDDRLREQHREVASVEMA